MQQLLLNSFYYFCVLIPGVRCEAGNLRREHWHGMPLGGLDERYVARSGIGNRLLGERAPDNYYSLIQGKEPCFILSCHCLKIGAHQRLACAATLLHISRVPAECIRASASVFPWRDVWL